MTTPNNRNLRASWSPEMAADFAAFHGNKSHIPYGKEMLEPGIMFRLKIYPQDTYVILEKHTNHHIVFSNLEETKFTHDGGFDLNQIQIFEGNNDRA